MLDNQPFYRILQLRNLILVSMGKSSFLITQMEVENNRVVQGKLVGGVASQSETPNVNSNEGTPSGRSTPYVGTPSVHSSVNIGRGDLGSSVFNSMYLTCGAL